MFTISEKKIIKKIRVWITGVIEPYYFWFVYDNDGDAVSWEGGTGLIYVPHFRNEYCIESGGQIKKNENNKEK